VNNLAALAIFSGLSLNLLIQGVGIQDFNREPYRPLRFVFFQCFSQFVSLAVFWCFFAYVLTPLSMGFFEYFLIFPLTASADRFWELLFARLFPRPDSQGRLFSMAGVRSGFVTIALLVTLRLASSFSEALVLALGFSLGFLAAVFILRAILGRFSGETIPRSLRGTPLLLVAIGLLALVFSSLSVIFLRLLKFP
jgi:electron transport complex protein RnfA